MTAPLVKFAAWRSLSDEHAAIVIDRERPKVGDAIRIWTAGEKCPTTCRITTVAEAPGTPPGTYRWAVRFEEPSE